MAEERRKKKEVMAVSSQQQQQQYCLNVQFNWLCILGNARYLGFWAVAFASA